MPLDALTPDLTLDLPAPGRDVEVMTRVLRLPTRSMRQARAIVRLQLDRLSPLPPNTVLFDLVQLSPVGAEAVYALGILRKSALQEQALANQRRVALARTVEGREVVFRFRNPAAVDDREARWLAHAPKAALLALAAAAVALAGQIRADQWREHQLPLIAADQRLAASAAREARDRMAALTEWRALDRSDATTRLLCVTSLVAGRDPRSLAITGARGDAGALHLTIADTAALARLEAAGGRSASAGVVAFGEEVCR